MSCCKISQDPNTAIFIFLSIIGFRLAALYCVFLGHLCKPVLNLTMTSLRVNKFMLF